MRNGKFIILGALCMGMLVPSGVSAKGKTKQDTKREAFLLYSHRDKFDMTHGIGKYKSAAYFTGTELRIAAERFNRLHNWDTVTLRSGGHKPAVSTLASMCAGIVSKWFTTRLLSEVYKGELKKKLDTLMAEEARVLVSCAESANVEFLEYLKESDRRGQPPCPFGIGEQAAKTAEAFNDWDSIAYRLFCPDLSERKD